MTFIEISDLKKTFRRNSFLYWKKKWYHQHRSIVIIIITDGKYFFLVETFNEIYCGGHHHYHNDEGCPNHSFESPYKKICSNHRSGCFRKYVIPYQVFSTVFIMILVTLSLIMKFYCAYISSSMVWMLTMLLNWIEYYLQHFLHFSNQLCP